MTTNFTEKRTLRFRIIFCSSENVQIFFSFIFSDVSGTDKTNNGSVEGKGGQEDYLSRSDNRTELLNTSVDTRRCISCRCVVDES